MARSEVIPSDCPGLVVPTTAHQLANALVALLSLTLPSWAAELTGRVVGLSDGDTITILTAERRQVRIRLGEIDTPESRRPYGARALWCTDRSGHLGRLGS
ncbi:thermonuclease family protein [Roseomonas sp. WA12]